jgi:hypothetical protein
MSKVKTGWAQWFMTTIPATQEIYTQEDRFSPGEN